MPRIPYLHKTTSRGITYFRYHLPDGAYEPLGTDEAKAIDMAVRLNVIRAAKEHARQHDRYTISAVISEFRDVKNRTSKSAATKEQWEVKFRQYERHIGKWQVAGVTVREIDEFLQGLAPLYEPYRTHRLLLGEIFTYAIGRGWREQAKGNPAKALLPPKLARAKGDKVRARMSAAQFDLVRGSAPGWLQLAMDTARLIGIRRGDVCRLKFSDFRDGYLFFIPEKTADLPTPAAIKIPLQGPLADLLEKAQHLAPQSEYFIHRVNSFSRTGESVHRVDRTQVLPEQLSRHFKKSAQRAGVVGSDAPTYHEIRSLCAREYGDKGWDVKKVQLLLGHADESMTEYYQSGAGVNWCEVAL